MRFIWQSWGDHSDVAQAALVYVLLLLTIFVYCQFGEELSRQVTIIWLLQSILNNKILTFFSSHELQQVNLAVLFMLNSDMYTEFFYQAEFQIYRGLYLCKIVLHVLMKQAETYP